MKRTKQSGAALMLAIFTMVALLLIVTTFSLRLDSHIKSETNRLDQRKADLAIEAGIARAMAAITDADVNVTNNTDEWVTLGQSGAESFTVGDSTVRMQILDSTRFVNINTATEAQLQRMNLSDDQVAALLDWREEQLQPRLTGAKDEYYNNLQTPYNTRLRAMESITDLFLVKGFTPYLILNPPENTTSNILSTGSTGEATPLVDMITVDSQSPNVRADGSQRVNLNVAQNAQLVQAGLSNQVAQAIVQRRNTQGQFTSFNQVFGVAGLTPQNAKTILNIATITNETTLIGKININTAPDFVLRSIPEFTEDVVQAIISRQGTFTELGDLADIPGISTNTLNQVADLFTISCQSFVVRLEGIKGTTHSFMEATITITGGQAKVTKMFRPLQRNPLTLWAWDEEATSETPLLDPN
ncbi:MAG: helix-hairpin-helix domain-containing protein [Fimbriimonadaceae bacterium]